MANMVTTLLRTIMPNAGSDRFTGTTGGSGGGAIDEHYRNAIGSVLEQAASKEELNEGLADLFHAWMPFLDKDRTEPSRGTARDAAAIIEALIAMDRLEWLDDLSKDLLRQRLSNSQYLDRACLLMS